MLDNQLQETDGTDLEFIGLSDNAPKQSPQPRALFFNAPTSLLMLLWIDQKLTLDRVIAYSFFLAVAHWVIWLYFTFVYFNLASGLGVSEPGTPFGNDFLAFWSAADLAVQGRALDAYDSNMFREHQLTHFPEYKGLLPWLYPPTFQLLLMPFGLFNYFAAACSFMVAGAIMFSAALYRVIPMRAALIPIIAFPGILVAILHGQNALIMGALFVAALTFLNSRPVLAGVFLGLLTAKPHYGILLPLVLLAGGHLRCFMSAAATTAIFFALAALVLGFETLLAFPAATAQMQTWMHTGQAPMYMMVTFFAHALRSGISVEMAWLLHLFVALPVSAMTVMIWRKQQVSAPLKYALLLAATLLISPYFMKYDLVLVGAALTFLTAHNLNNGWRPGERLLMVILWLSPTISYFVLDAQSVPIMPALSLALFVLVYTRSRQEAVKSCSPTSVGPACVPDSDSLTVDAP